MSGRSDRRFLITDMLCILRDSDPRKGLTEDAIRSKLRAAIKASRADGADGSYVWDLHLYLQENGGSRAYLRGVLQDLASVGLLEGEPVHGSDVPEEMVWRVDRDWFKSRPSLERELADGGDEIGPPPEDGDDEGGEGDRGPGGLGDVLAHPFLFAVGDDDLEAAVLTAMGGGE